MVLEGLRHARSDAVTVSAIVLDTCGKDLPYESSVIHGSCRTCCVLAQANQTVGN